MNSPNNPEYLESVFRQAEQSVDYFLHDKERVCAYNTLQVKDYSKFNLDGFSVEEKPKWHDDHWVEKTQNAFDAGARMAKKILAE